MSAIAGLSVLRRFQCRGSAVESFYALEDKRLLRAVLPPAAHRCKRGLRRSRSRRRRECSAAAWQKARLFSPLTSHLEGGHSAARRNSAERLSTLRHDTLGTRYHPV